MLNAIKRVISCEDVNMQNRDETTDQTPLGAVAEIDDSLGPRTPQSDQGPGSPVLVENDMDIDVPRSAMTSGTPRSSISDMSAAEHQESVGPLPVEDGKISGSDQGSDSNSSVNRSSQTSSRDWGWFEDVHIGETINSAKRKGSAPNAKAGTPSTPPKTTPKKSSRGGVGTIMIPTSSLEGVQLTVPINLESAAAMAVTAPTYVLEESLSSQKLWKYTAGNRPPQPVEERAFFEKMWAQNFARSQVEYTVPQEVLTAATPLSLSPFADGNFNEVEPNDSAGGGHSHLESYGTAGMMETTTGNNNLLERPAEDGRTHKIDGGLTVYQKGDNVFGTTVSKSFTRPPENGNSMMGVDTVNVSVASYRVVESKKHGKYAQFLVIYREGSIRDTMGVWKRYSDFQELSKKVTQANDGCIDVIANMSPLAVTMEQDVEHLPNAITSWHLLKKRQRWYRCLDSGYLSLKVFLLERFLHDILFESSSPELLRDFVSGEVPSDATSAST